VFTVDDGSLPPNPPTPALSPIAINFTPEKIFSAFKRLKPSFSSGPDGLNAYFLKKNPPIFKKASPHSVENYRPISLCCVTCKLMESIVNKFLVDFLTVNKLLSDKPFGFQKQKSCALQLTKCTNSWINFLDNKKPVDVVYVDFQKAFDTVVHSQLLLKLKAIIPNRFLLTWFGNFLSGRTQTVIVNNCVSNPVNVTSGVPQGSVLGPTLFLLYINDLVDCIKHSQITLFADYLKIFNTSDKQALLQQDLENLSFWAKTWPLSISLTKTNVLYLGNSNPNFRYSLDDVVLCRCRTISLFLVISKTLFQKGLRYLLCYTEVLSQKTGIY